MKVTRVKKIKILLIVLTTLVLAGCSQKEPAIEEPPIDLTQAAEAVKEIETASESEPEVSLEPEVTIDEDGVVSRTDTVAHVHKDYADYEPDIELSKATLYLNDHLADLSFDYVVPDVFDEEQEITKITSTIANEHPETSVNIVMHWNSDDGDFRFKLAISGDYDYGYTAYVTAYSVDTGNLYIGRLL